MIKIKCFSEFDGPHSQVLISGEEEDYLYAYNYLVNKSEARLNDSNFAIYYDSGILTQDKLRLNQKECSELAEIFARCKRPKRCHFYFDTLALKNIMDIKISIGEYPNEIFSR